MLLDIIKGMASTASGIVLAGFLIFVVLPIATTVSCVGCAGLVHSCTSHR